MAVRGRADIVGRRLRHGRRQILLLLLLLVEGMLLVERRCAGRLRRTGAGAAQTHKHILRSVVRGGKRPRAMEIRVAGADRGRTIVVELIAGMAHIVELCIRMLIAGIIVSAAQRRWWRRRRRQRRRRCRLLQQHALPIGIIVNGIQRYVAAIIVIVALAQAADGHVVVVVQALQIGGGQRGAMK